MLALIGLILVMWPFFSQSLWPEIRQSQLTKDTFLRARIFSPQHYGLKLERRASQGEIGTLLLKREELIAGLTKPRWFPRRGKRGETDGSPLEEDREGEDQCELKWSRRDFWKERRWGDGSSPSQAEEGMGRLCLAVIVFLFTILHTLASSDHPHAALLFPDFP